MCGINAIVRRNSAPVDKTDLALMNSAIAHRGPDGSGFALLNQRRVGLGHVRLSIIDIHDGAQPLYNEDGSICIVFNGEIYDYKRLRTNLIERGHRFRTHSDTEVIVHLYEEYGENLFEHLNGEFAFIIWDQRRRRIFAGRDRFGVKPLFYYVGQDKVTFSSEVKGIFALNRVPRKFDPDYFVGPFFAAFPKSMSAFAGVQSLNPGHYLIMDEGRAPYEIPYWEPRFKTDEAMTRAEAERGVADLLTKAVERRMVADVPVGAYLSGGLDSTLVCALMSASSNKPRAFSIGFGRTAYDESSVARDTADFYGAEFSTIDCNDDILAAEFEKSVFHCEQPLANPNSVAKVRLSQLVRESGYKVCLTGEGADELFGGYPFFKIEQLWQMMGDKGEVRRRGKALYREFLQLEERSEGLLWNRTRKWKRMKRHFGYPSFHEARMMSANLFYGRVFADSVRAESHYAKPMDYLLAHFPPETMRELHPLNSTRRIAMNQLQSYIIPSLGDRVEMANSVECRTPFLDKDLVEFALKIPPRYLLDIERLAEKDVLRKAFLAKLPTQVARTGKHPFMAPNWYSVTRTQRGREIMEWALSPRTIRNSGIFDPGFIRRFKLYWNYTPKSWPIWKRFDILGGLIVSTQIMHHMFIEKPIPASKDFSMVDKSPAPEKRAPVPEITA